MAVAIFYIAPDKYKEAKKVVESDPYETDSFARVGYKLKEAKTLGLDKEGYYLYIDAGEEFIAQATKKLEGVAERKSGEEAESVKKAVEEEEASASAGIGNLFG
ncbi:MAG: hypothetical protein D6769_01945 [Methanobacteriota archaeon]|nr:MAG: hypothetical protein D6769_01945 [Euryarchaeota archaeon]